MENSYYQNNKESLKEYAKIYYIKNKEKIKKDRVKNKSKWSEKRKSKQKEYYKTNYREKQLKFITMYGGRCVCCGEGKIEFLTIEHKLGQIGKKKDTSFKAYSLAIEKYQPDIYEILCMNCNHAKGRYGICPHKS